MHISARKEEFSRAYVKSIAAQAGLKHATDSIDNDGIDLTLKGSGYTGKVRNPQIEIQLKCTSQDVVKNDVIKYPLKLKNYNELRGKNIVAPRYLMVLVVPDDELTWTRHDNDSLILSHTCYWKSLRFAPETTNTVNVTVEIPSEQILTFESLHDLMKKASKGEYI